MFQKYFQKPESDSKQITEVTIRTAQCSDFKTITKFLKRNFYEDEPLCISVSNKFE